jgi:hypothetical protein
VTFLSDLPLHRDRAVRQPVCAAREPTEVTALSRLVWARRANSCAAAPTRAPVRQLFLSVQKILFFSLTLLVFA